MSSRQSTLVKRENQVAGLAATDTTDISSHLRDKKVVQVATMPDLTEEEYESHQHHFYTDPMEYEVMNDSEEIIIEEASDESHLTSSGQIPEEPVTGTDRQEVEMVKGPEMDEPQSLRHSI